MYKTDPKECNGELDPSLSAWIPYVALMEKVISSCLFLFKLIMVFHLFIFYGHLPYTLTSEMIHRAQI